MGVLNGRSTRLGVWSSSLQAWLCGWLGSGVLSSLGGCGLSLVSSFLASCLALSPSCNALPHHHPKAASPSRPSALPVLCEAFVCESWRPALSVNSRPALCSLKGHMAVCPFPLTVQRLHLLHHSTSSDTFSPSRP